MVKTLKEKKALTKISKNYQMASTYLHPPPDSGCKGHHSLYVDSQRPVCQFKVHVVLLTMI